MNINYHILSNILSNNEEFIEIKKNNIFILYFMIWYLNEFAYLNITYIIIIILFKYILLLLIILIIINYITM